MAQVCFREPFHSIDLAKKAFPFIWYGQAASDAWNCVLYLHTAPALRASTISCVPISALETQVSHCSQSAARVARKRAQNMCWIIIISRLQMLYYNTKDYRALANV